MRPVRLFALVALVALAVVPYAGAIHAPLLYDDRTLLDNPWLVNEAGLASVFRHDYWFGTKHEHSDLYRPLTVLSLAWNARAAPSREGFRAVNLALHALTTLALWWMLRVVSTHRKGTAPMAWIGAALFAVHPLGSEAVLWVVGRAEILAALFGIVAFVLFVRLDETRGLGGHDLALSVAAFSCALCFKESAAAWLAIGTAWMVLRPTDGGTPRRVVLIRGACYLSAFAAYIAVRASAVGWRHSAPPFIDNPLVDAGVLARVANAVLLFARYLGKMLWPRALSVEYGFDQLPVVPVVPWGAIGAAAVVAGVVAVVVILQRRGHAAAAFLAAFIPAAFAVTGNVAFPIGTMFAERLAYLPLAGACGLLALALAAIPRSSWRVLAVSVLLAACGSRAFARGGDYRDAATLSLATAAASPRAVKALVNAGRVRLRQHDVELALPLLEKAVAIWPGYARAWELLAEAYAAAGDPTRAEEARRRAVASSSGVASGGEPL